MKCLKSLCLCLALVGCNSSNLEVSGDGLPSESLTSWSLTAATKSLFNFDSNIISFGASSAQLKQVKQDFSSADFNAGTSVGLVLNSSSRLSLDTTSAADRSLASSWVDSMSGLVGYWKLDNNLNDQTGTSSAGTAGAGVVFVTDAQVGTHSAQFSVDGDEVTVSDDANYEFGTGDFSVSAWVKGDASRGQETIVSKGGGANVGFNMAVNYATGTVSCRIHGTGGSDQSLDSNFRIPFEGWAHIACVYDRDDKVYLYIDGALDNSASFSAGNTGSVSNGAHNLLFGALTNGVEELSGQADDISLWNVALDAGDVRQIFDRQKQAFSGSHTSPVIHAGGAASWPNISWVTPLPFLKNLSGASGNEETTSYQELVSQAGTAGNSDLATGLIGHYTFDGPLGAIPGTESFTDFSAATGNDGNIFSNTGRRVPGVIGQAYHTNINGEGTQFSGIADDFNGAEGTMSFWMKRYFHDDDNTSGLRTYVEGYVSSTNRIDVYYHSGPNLFYFRRVAAGNTQNFLLSESDIPAGKWIHVTLSWSETNDQFRLYLDGVECTGDGSPMTGLASMDASLTSFGIGNNAFMSSAPSGGAIDELSVWNRPLHPSEVVENYRRGANRIKVQVRSCVDENCNCKSFGAGGKTNDCDGDSTLNANDPGDIHRAEWLGAQGVGTYFSELNSCGANVDADGFCTAAPVNTSANVALANFPAAAIPGNAPYFQFRLSFEAEANNLCTGSSTCLPELTSFKAGPDGRYFMGDAVISPTTGVSFSELKGLEFSEAGTCTLKYQISADGTNYYYWNGAAWTTASAEDLAQASSSADIVAQLSGLSTLFSAGGELRFKAFMTSDGTQSCEISAIDPDIER